MQFGGLGFESPRHHYIYVTVNLDVSRTYSGESQEPELGGPCTVGDSFEPLGVFMIVT